MLHTVLIWAQVVLLSTVGSLVMYLFALSVLAAFARGLQCVTPTQGRRFAVLIPAHNEQFTIAPTIQSVLQADYPRQLFDVIVIADNCTDRTANVGQDQGALVLIRQNNELRGKGYALRWCIDRLLAQQNQYDAFIVVDADSLVSVNFLGIMNSYLQQGALVIQSSDLVKPQPGAWSSEMTRLGFTLYNYVRPLGRRILGCSAGLRGNGMCFASQVLRTHPWQAYSRAEDLEFGLYLLLNGIPVRFAPEAGVLATMPQNPELAESQRLRWEVGRFPVIRTYALPLLQKGLFHGALSCFDAFIDLVTPALMNLMVIVLGVLLTTVIMNGAGVNSMHTFVFLWMGVFLFGFLHVFIGLFAARADRFLYRALLYLPRYAAWKILLYLKLAGQGGTKDWVRTTREPDAAPENPAKV